MDSVNEDKLRQAAEIFLQYLVEHGLIKKGENE